MSKKPSILIAVIASLFISAVAVGQGNLTQPVRTAYTAGDGLTLTGSDFDVNAGPGIIISGDAVTLDTSVAFLDSDITVSQNKLAKGGATADTLVDSAITDDATGNYVELDRDYSLFGGTVRGSVYTSPGSLNFFLETNGEATGLINDLGYGTGIAQFRNLQIRDGKGGTIATFDGSDRSLTMTPATGASIGGVIVDGNMAGYQFMTANDSSPTFNAWTSSGMSILSFLNSGGGGVEVSVAGQLTATGGAAHATSFSATRGASTSHAAYLGGSVEGSYFAHGAGEETYIRGGKLTSVVYVGDTHVSGGTAAVILGSTTGYTQVQSRLGVRIAPDANTAALVDGSGLSYGVWAVHSSTGFAGTPQAGRFQVSSSLDATAALRESYALVGSDQSTKSAGANATYGHGVYGEATGVGNTGNIGGKFLASGAASDIAIQADGDDYSFYGSDGTLYNLEAVDFDSTLDVGGVSTFAAKASIAAALSDATTFDHMLMLRNSTADNAARLVFEDATTTAVEVQLWGQRVSGGGGLFSIQTRASGDGGMATWFTLDRAGTLDHNGQLAKFGNTSDGAIYFLDDKTINFAYATDADTTGYLNYYGYNGGPTRFRNLVIADGKGATACTFTGSTKTLNCVGGLQVNGTNVATTSSISGTSGRSARFAGSNTVGTGALVDDGTNVYATDGSFFAWDDSSARVGFTKKSGASPKLTFGSATDFAIAQSSTASIAASSTYTDKFTISAAGAIGLAGATTVTGTLNATGAVDLDSTLNVDGDISDSNSDVTIEDGLIVSPGAAPTGLGALGAGSTLVLEVPNGTVNYIAFRSTSTKGLTFYNGSGSPDAGIYLDGGATLRDMTFQTGGTVRAMLDDAGTWTMGDHASSHHLISDNVDVLKIGNTGTAQTASTSLLSMTHTGSFNATAAQRVAVGINVAMTSTRSAGANDVTNKAATFSASGAQTNWALETGSGDVRFNVTSGSTTMLANTTIGDANTDTLTITSKINSHVYYTGTAPTLSACGTASASIVGNDRRGKIIPGTGSPTSCTITFATAWTTNAPICVISGTQGTERVGSVSTTALVITNPTGWASAAGGGADQPLYYACDGWL